MPRSPMRSDPLKQDVDVERRALAKVHRMRVEERLRRLSTFVAQVGEERPFRIELRRRAQFGQDRVPHRESYMDIVMVSIVGGLLALAVVIVLGSAVGSF